MPSDANWCIADTEAGLTLMPHDRGAGRLFGADGCSAG
jgi:hypothetical protein